MNIKKLINALIVLAALQSSVALAQNDLIELTDGSVAAGQNIAFEVRWTNNSGTANLQFDIPIDPPGGGMEFEFVSCAIDGAFSGGDYFGQCNSILEGPTDNTVRLAILNTQGDPIAGSDALMATVTLTAVGPPGSYSLPVEDIVVDSGTPDTDPAMIDILGASYDSTPAAPGPFNFGSLTMDVDPDGVLPFEISNDGEAGTTLNGSCAISGPGAAAFSQTPDNTFAVVEGGAADMSSIVCDSGAAVGNYTATLSCSHDGDSNPASPVDYDLVCNIVAAPSPEYGSTPAPGVAFDFGTLTTADPSADLPLTIENVGNADGLDGSCSITSNPNTAYSIDDVGAYGPLAQAATAGRVVTCDTSVLGDHTGGVLSCTHNGSILATPVTYPLNCVVEPTPEYDSTPGSGMALPGMNGDQGDGVVMASTLAIANVGEAGSTMTGSCSMVTGTTITIPNGAFSVAQGAQQNITLNCDDSAQGTYDDTVTCTADAGTTNPGPHTYPVQCIIDPPDAGMFGSTPGPGGVIELTPGGAVVEGTDLTNAAQLLVRNAGEVGDEDIDYTCSITGGSPEITQSPSPSAGSLVAGDPDTVINYSCDTTANGMFSATVQCVWTAPLEGAGGTEDYTATCDVRDPFTEVVESPPSGTPQTADLMPGENTVFSFDFTEVIDEGGTASLDDCVLATGTDFAITAPGGFPQPIPSGSTVTVDVTFTDPGVGDTFNDTLSCAATHQPPLAPVGEGAEYFVSWPLEVSVVGRNATVRVTKDFSDDNPAGVEVFMECNTGLPLQQSGTIYDPDSGPGPGQFTFIDFVVVDFAPGTMDCDVSETVPAGYEATYFADIGANGVAGSVTSDEEGCHYDDIESADFICEITNDLLPVDVVVEKEWIDEHPEYQLPTVVEVTLVCSDPIVDGFGCFGPSGGNGTYCATRFIDPNNPGEFQVFPHYEGTVCSATEELEAGVVADQTDCEEMILLPGQGDSCVIVNTRLFAGIPTLSQYGLILMALLMLGVGAVAFRRYS